MLSRIPNGKVIKKVADRIPHDFRRTAVRNVERAGVARSAAMKMVGHKTESIYRRQAIADESMLQEAGEKLARLHSAEENFKLGKKSLIRLAIPTKYPENSHTIE